MTDRDRQLQTWIQRARMDAPNAEQLARTRERVLFNAMNLSASDAGQAPSSNATHTSGTWWSAQSIALGIKVIGVSVLLGLGLFALRASLAPRSAAKVAPARVTASQPERRPPALPAQPTMPKPPPTADASLRTPVAAPAPRPSEQRPASARSARTPARRTTQPADSTAAGDARQSFAQEVTLLRAAIEAHRRGDDADARRKLAEHERTYPISQLDQERKRLAAELGAQP